MGDKSFKFILLMVFIGASFNSLAIDNNALNPPVDSTVIEPSQQKNIISTKTIQTKPIKKSKNQSSSLGLFKLLIPNSLK